MVTKAASALALVYFASNAFAAVPGDAGVAQSSSEPSHVEAPAAAPTTPSSSPSSPDPNLPPSAPTSTDPSAALASTPPPSAASPLPLPSTSSSLDASSSEETRGKDFSHGLEFVYLNIEGGYQTVGLRTLSTSNLLPETVESTSNGAFFGAGAGLRLIFLTIGPRFRIGHFSSWNLWTLGAEAGIHLPLGRVEPYLSLTASYAKLATDASTL
ncbi:MAG TPA: hypothetical protein VJT73_17050, partial [Polyangiaceae bacterium]|nr:hypothetical protein [Polyangiaceae bacterium]